MNDSTDYLLYFLLGIKSKLQENSETFYIAQKESSAIFSFILEHEEDFDNAESISSDWRYDLVATKITDNAAIEDIIEILTCEEALLNEADNIRKLLFENSISFYTVKMGE